jgi:DnaJ-class molecular chaperone
MKCEYCSGKGEIINDAMRWTSCPACGGKGFIDMTNEEWFDTLPTKEKAEWLDKVAENCCQICDEENRELCRANIATGCKFENAEKWEMWLKEKHE